jgi:hypothetical protein
VIPFEIIIMVAIIISISDNSIFQNAKLEEVRKLRHNKKRRQRINQNIADSNDDSNKELLYVNS